MRCGAAAASEFADRAEPAAKQPPKGGVGVRGKRGLQVFALLARLPQAGPGSLIVLPTLNSERPAGTVTERDQICQDSTAKRV